MSSFRYMLGCWLLAQCFFASAATEEGKVDFLLEKLQSSSSFKVRLKAAIMLGRLADGRAVEPLCQALLDENYIVRAAAARALSNLGYPKAGPAVAPLFELAAAERESFVQKEIDAALTSLIGEESLEVYLQAAGNLEPKIRRLALKMLTTIEDNRARQALVRALGDEDDLVNQEAERCVLAIPADRIDALLIDALDNPKAPRTQLAAIQMVKKRRLDTLLEDLSALLARDDVLPDVKMEARQAIAKMKAGLDIDRVIRGAFSENKEEQSRAINILGIHAGSKAVDALIRLLADRNEFVRRRAVDALYEAEDPKAVPVLEKMLNTEKNPQAQQSIRRTLKRLQSREPN